MNIIMSMTWKELLRKRVMLLTLIMTVVFLIGFWFVAGAIGGNDSFEGTDINSAEQLIQRFANGAFILTFGFFFGAFVIAFLSIFSSFSALSGEAEQGVLQALLPRPLPRWKWYLGRWLGYVIFGAAYALLLFIAILLITQAHAAIPRDLFILLKSFLLFASVVPVIISISMLGSGFLSAIGNGVFMTMLYGAGWLGGMIDKVSGSLPLKPDALQSLQNMTGLMSLIIPADGLQRKMIAELFSFNELSGMLPINESFFGVADAIPSNSFVIYAVLYTVVVLLMGMYRFERKDL
ncbi:ABC transporter permease [Paenibacillus wynnii]|uniref:ABC transporter permease n=1 Tax=Paenibacillus wynnii TaxID=268407 RepID=UPI002791B6AC|nr:ABC transporter permease subunit [Paenibacillus wynnii]MDQ0194321.1 ABC-type transport system involved in multi-copper enzyme maturation permease subunit [Paenibacillus wynnii]